MKSFFRSALLLLALGSFAASSASAAPVILNEYNAVGPTVYLDTATFAGSTKSDTYFGRILGNGNNWFELVVIDDHLDMREWALEWAYNSDANNFGSGSLALTNDPLWSDIRSGTILTFGEYNAADPTRTTPAPTDTSFDRVGGDWWINVRTDSTQYVTTSGTVTTASVPAALPAGEFSVNNDNWKLTIKDKLSNIVYGPAGEGVFVDGGINSNEVYKLEFPGPGATLADWQSITPTLINFNDGTSSSFGAPNVWTTAPNTFVQDMSAIQAVPEPSTWLLAMVGSALAAVPAVRRRWARRA